MREREGNSTTQKQNQYVTDMVCRKAKKAKYELPLLTQVGWKRQLLHLADFRTF